MKECRTSVTVEECRPEEHVLSSERIVQAAFRTICQRQIGDDYASHFVRLYGDLLGFNGDFPEPAWKLSVAVRLTTFAYTPESIALVLRDVERDGTAARTRFLFNDDRDAVESLLPDCDPTLWINRKRSYGHW